MTTGKVIALIKKYIKQLADQVKDWIGLAGQRAGYIDENTSAFPTTRPSGDSVQEEDYVEVSSTAQLPFEIQGIQFKTKLDKAIYRNGQWIFSDGSKVTTAQVGLTSKVTETLDDSANTQNEVNVQFAQSLKTIIVVIDDVDKVTKIERKPYYQYTDTAARRTGFYWYNIITDKWEPLGSGSPDGKSILLNVANKLELNGYESASVGYMPVKSENGINWVEAINKEALDEAVARAKASADQAGVYSTMAGNSAVEAKEYHDDMLGKFFIGDMAAYRAAIEQGQIKPDTIAIITAERAIIDN